MMALTGQPLVAANGSGQLHGWLAVLATLAFSLPFAAIGFVLVTNYKGLAHRFVDSAAKPPRIIERPISRVNLAIMGSEENVERFNRDIMPKIVGWPFLVFGVLLSGGSLIALVVLGVRAVI